MNPFCMISLNVRHILSVMPFYAVAKGRQIGIYKSWGECEKVVKGFMGAKYRKFDKEEDAINFIQLYGSETKGKAAQKKGNSDGNNSCSSLYEGIRPILSQGDKITFPKSLSQESSASSKSATIMSDVPEIEKSPLPKSLSQQSPRVSTPKLKVDALKQRMMLLENMYFKSMLELRSEIDSTKERIESVCACIDAGGEAGDAENIKTLQDCVSELAKHYRETVSELKEEIESLKETVKTLDLGQKNVETEKASTSAVSSFKRNLFKEALEPVATKRLYSNKAGEKSNLGKRKNTDSDYGECSKVMKQEPLAYDDDCDSDNKKFLLTGFEVDEDGYVQVYTDGACEKNGRVGAKAGVGVWFGNNNPLNYSEPVQGRTTNNTAEIQAATCAVDLARKAGIKNLKIHTDSQFLINCITIWIHKWKKKGWKVADGSQVKNKEDLIALDQAMEGMNIRWNHVRGHRGNYGNEMADQLARAGAKKSHR